MTQLNEEQKHVFDEVVAFVKNPDAPRPYYLYEGLAGTGKSFLLHAIARRFPNATICAPFAKAAANIARRTGLPTSTVHSAIYNFAGEDKETGDLYFREKIDEDEWRGRVALLDEHSTCGSKLGADLIATGCKVIACGDPGQLPPVKDVEYFQRPDFTLQTIHRQAWDSPIIRQAHSVRSGAGYVADGDDFRVQRSCSVDDVLNADMIACWTNATRRALNVLKREYLGCAARPPLKGEPIMCLKNDRKAAVLNGALYTLLEDHIPGCGYVRVVNERNEVVRLNRGWIEDWDEPPEEDPNNPHALDHPFALAYCATTHKLQGSEIDTLLLVDEMPSNRQEYIRWCYTGITRAAKRVIIKA